jgi:acyl-CoA synthetase (AMP-forming)/AMP-acid ligase II
MVSVAPILRWLEDPSEDTGFYFAKPGEEWDFLSYAELAASATHTARELVERGVQPGQVVTLVLPSAAEFTAAFFAVHLAGAVPTVLVPPTMFQSFDVYVKAAAAALQSTHSQRVLTSSALVEILTPACELAGRRPPLVLDFPENPVRAPCTPIPNPSGLALLQLTSGSTGNGRPVQVTHENLEANILSIRRWLRMSPDDATASWLPLYHDMGLIGCFLTPVHAQTSVWLMTPEQFIEDPRRWLSCFGSGAATLTASPNFGFAYVARKVAPGELEGMDFSRWRVAIVGAEHIDASALERFTALTGPHGFERRTFMPAYGLAEATLAVTGGLPDAAPLAVKLDWSKLSMDSPAPVVDAQPLGEAAHQKERGWLVSCGTPHPGMHVELRPLDADPGHDSALPEGYIGEILVRGPSVSHGYVDAVPEGATRFTLEGLRTGDAGFFHQGQLFVLGRIGDSTKIRGRPVYVETLESRLIGTGALRAGNFVVMTGMRDAALEIALVAELDPGDWATKAASLFQRELGEEVPVRIYAAPRGTLLRTSSGKPRRRAMWACLMAGQLEAKAI